MLKSTLLGTALLVSAVSSVSAADLDWGVQLPVPQIPGYNFPEPEATVLGWVNANQANNIYLHGWGLWDALTSPSGTTAYGIADAPVYLTWVTREDLVAASKVPAPGLLATSRRLRLGEVTQLRKFGVHSMEPKAMTTLKAAAGITPDTNTLETVTYDPQAGQTIYNGKLFQLATLKQLYTAGQPEVPAFPVNALAVKPVYKVASKATLYQGRYYVMPAWPGTPEVTPAIKRKGFGEADWNAGCVYVDTQNSGSSTAKAVDPACSGPTPATTYGLGDFVHYTLTADNAKLFDLGNGKGAAAPGDTLLLMAMHVSTREITEWTWQTFFWTPDPANPPLPSSAAAGAARPAQLTGSAAHYAASFAYEMVDPNQPVDGGTSTGAPVVGYNPYLEAGFKAKVFSISRPIVSAPGGTSWTGTVGVQTNCMTCHSLAAVRFAKGTAPGYGTDFYIARNDPYFTGTVQTEFLWSIADVDSGQQKTSEAPK